ncbi:MAG: hypothetical protein D3917_04150 [Candidatus Electrothrix sp. AX5]|nr:hypothetical protein [Candidatus Electrothrix sp. AX5]
MKRYLKVLWHWSWVLTLPICIIFAVWLNSTVDRYYTFGVRYNSAPAKMTLYRAGELEAAHMVRKARLALSSSKSRRSAVKNTLRTLNVFIPDADLGQLNSNLPHSGFNYVPGMLMYDGELKKVKVKYRGDFLPHWGFFKKSLRIKTKKKALFEGMRAFNIIAPKGKFHLHNYLGYKLANYLDLMAPYSEMVLLNLNGEEQGLHILVEQLEELTLRKHGRMPGDLYVGELVAKDSYKGVNSKVFEHPGLWKKIAVNNHYPEESRKPLEHLLQLLNAPSSDKIQTELSKIMDMSAWGKFSAFETLGQTFHFDHTHNWRLYYDPMQSKFVPIVWDAIPWTTDRSSHVKGLLAKPDMIRTSLHIKLFRNGDFLRARQEAMDSFFRNGRDKQFLVEVDNIISSTKTAIQYDPNLTHDQTRIEKVLNKKRVWIGNILNDVREVFYEKKDAVLCTNTAQGIDISISGRKLVRKTSIRYLYPFQGKISAKIKYWLDNEEIVKDVTGAMSIRGGSQIDLEVPLMARMQFLAGDRGIKNELDVQPSYYKVILQGISSDNRLLEVSVDQGDAQLEKARQVQQIKKTSFVDSSLILHEKPEVQPLVWHGDIKIEGQQLIDTELIIQPGTTVFMSPGSSLILQGRLIAEGTPDHPIRFVSTAQDLSPWGTVVLQGNKADGSSLKYCEFSNGSGLKSDLFEYTAMLSIHNVKRVKISHCLFRDSQVTDDMVHAVYSEVQFKSCTFQNSLFDALDIDISQVVVEHCNFIQSGNDAIDLMTSRAVVTDTLIQGSKDKAISVGEGSSLFAVNNVFQGNGIAVQAKDGSVASLYNVDLYENKHALDVYKKNWRYGNGGKIFFYKGRLRDNEKMITAGKKSSISIFDTFIDRSMKEKKKRIIFKRVDTKFVRKARVNKVWQFPGDIELANEVGEKYRDKVDSNRRGASELVYR